MSTKAFFNGGIIVNNLNDIDLQTSTGNGVILKSHPNTNGTSKLILPFEYPTDNIFTGGSSRVLRWNTTKLSELQTNSEIYVEFYDDVELAQNVSNGIVNVTASTGNLNLNSTSGNVVITPNLGNKIYIDGNVKLSNILEVSSNTYSNIGGSSAVSRDTLAIDIVNIHLISDKTNYFYSMPTGFGGQQLNLFFTNNSTGTANIDFTASNLFTGSGSASGLTFTSSGQSAQLMYFDMSGNTENDYAFSGWRIINTGATIF